jgi:hypothetical protein
MGVSDMRDGVRMAAGVSAAAVYWAAWLEPGRA